jgi:hypothetical protein
MSAQRENGAPMKDRRLRLIDVLEKFWPTALDQRKRDRGKVAQRSLRITSLVGAGVQLEGVIREGVIRGRIDALLE